MLQRHSKWQIAHSCPQVNDVVILKDDPAHPLRWNLDKIVHLYPDANRHVQVVDVLVNALVRKRPISKLVNLPKAEETGFTLALLSWLH